MKKMIAYSLFVSVLSISMWSCQAWQNTSNTAKGGAIGTAGGAAAGAAIGKAAGNTVLGTIIGAAVGGTAGVLIGRRMDKQAEELEKELEGAEVERIGEGIHLTFDSGLLFDFNSSELTSETKQNLRELATSLSEYPGTDILIEGHTDSKGTEEYNQKLSEERASSVSSYLGALGVESGRLIIKGYGEDQPLETNETEEGRAKNRRVEVAIYANEELVEEAENGKI